LIFFLDEGGRLRFMLAITNVLLAEVTRLRRSGHELGPDMTIDLQARQPSSHAGMTLPDNEINLPEVLI
jgi:hypothetical protein